MPRLPLHAASGTGKFNRFAPKKIRLVRYGCTNRPFYHIVVSYNFLEQYRPPIEQLGTYDPIPNVNNEKLVSCNYERIQHWIGMGAKISKPVGDLLGLAGFLPIHPVTFFRAWKRRREARESKKAEEEATATKTEASAQN